MEKTVACIKCGKQQPVLNNICTDCGTALISAEGEESGVGLTSAPERGGTRREGRPRNDYWAAVIVGCITLLLILGPLLMDRMTPAQAELFQKFMFIFLLITFIVGAVLAVFLPARWLVREWKAKKILDAQAVPVLTGAEYAGLMGKNAERYISTFRKFRRENGTVRFAFTWHWPAFFVPWIWMLYRKLKGWSVALVFPFFVLPVIALAPLLVQGYYQWLYAPDNYSGLKLVLAVVIANSFWAVTANFIYFHSIHGTADRLICIRRLYSACMVTGALAVLMHIALPQFDAMPQRARDSAAVSDLRNCRTALEAYYADHNRYPSTLEEASCQTSKNVKLVATRLKKDAYTLFSYNQIWARYEFKGESEMPNIYRRPWNSSEEWQTY
jgi:hypothetical protein